MLQQEKHSNHLPVKGHLLCDAVWIGRQSFRKSFLPSCSECRIA